MQRVIYLIVIIPLVTGCANRKITSEDLPDRGICAHRGAMDTCPENTIAAFKEAVRLGAHMIEFDVRMTKDGHLVILHDATVDRTTDGQGEISVLTFDEVKQLDAGSWKSEDFSGEEIPALHEVLAEMPENIWLNIHIKGGAETGEMVARVIANENRLHQAILACGAEAATGAKQVNPDIMICNLDRLDGRDEYIRETIRQNCQFIQLHKSRTGQQFADEIDTLKQHQIKINYCCTDSEEEVKALFQSGVDFILTDRLSEMLIVATSMNIAPVRGNNN